MSALIYPLLGAVALLTAAACIVAMGRAAERRAAIQAADEPGRGIRVNPGREPW